MDVPNLDTPMPSVRQADLVGFRIYGDLNAPLYQANGQLFGKGLKPPIPGRDAAGTEDGQTQQRSASASNLAVLSLPDN